MKDAFYFSHDANAQRDPKILRLRQKHGWEGYGLFWALVEMLRNEEEYKLRTQYETYAFALQSHEDRIKSIVEDFELFTIEDGFFWSESLIRRMSIKNCKSEKARKSAMLRWSKKDDDANAMRMQCDGNAIKEKKGKERIDIVVQETRQQESIPFSQIVSFLNEKAGTDYKPTTKTTRGHIKARWSEGHRESDFLAVIESKCEEWAADPKMSEYLRPQTLFGTKFESYLQKAKNGGTGEWR